MSKLLVLKFGGTSVGSVARLQHVAGLIKEKVQEGYRLVVVVSAMGRFTDEILALASRLNPSPPERERDMLITTGERISISLLSIALDTLNIPSLSLTGSQSGILTDETHGNARIQKIRGDRIIEGLATFPVVIVAGFQGVSPRTRDITSLGRGGSDLSAVALSARLSAERCVVYTDVDGVMTSDPGLVPEARLIPRLSWDAMSEMTWTGAGVLHHRAALMAARFKVVTEIRSSFFPEKSGTLIKGFDSMEEAEVTACSCKRKQSLLRLTLDGSKASVLKLHTHILDWLWQKEESPLIGQYQGDSLGNGSQLIYLIGTELIAPLEEEIASFCEKNAVKVPEFNKTSDCASVSLTGRGFRQHPGMMLKAGPVLSDCCFFSDLQDRSLSWVVPENRAEKVLKSLHHTFLKPET